MSFGFLHLAPALTDFLARCPEFTVDVAMNDRFVDLVDEGFDVAVRIGAMEDSSLVARKLAPARRAFARLRTISPRAARRKRPDDPPQQGVERGPTSDRLSGVRAAPGEQRAGVCRVQAPDQGGQGEDSRELSPCP